MQSRVLLIDDCRVTAVTVTKYLEPLGFDVRVARTGEDGLRMALESRPDAILLDRRLPGIDGVEVCRRLRLADSTRDTPVLMITSTSDTRARVEAIELGADDYVVKPFEPDELRARLSRFVATRKEYSRRVIDERRNAIGQITLGLSHEINNPLATIIGQLSLLLRKESLDESARSRVEQALSGARRIQALVESASTVPDDEVTEFGGQMYVSIARKEAPSAT
jgi:two-component system sensor histidine kinase/response regulator